VYWAIQKEIKNKRIIFHGKELTVRDAGQVGE
jgi:hypothetical protein